MTLTPSEISSLAKALSRWELAEYICAGLVTIACAGEYVADFTNWLTDRVRERKERLAKRSTLLLIAALSLELICLVQTNALSGKLIGSLNEEAEGASVAASNALVLARGARQEADSFERDIVSAKQQAAEAESHLADALQRAANAEKKSREVQQALADRSLTDAQLKVIADKLKAFAGQEYDVTAYWDSKESVGIANRIHAALQMAGWKFLPMKEWHGLFGGVVGVQVWVHPQADTLTKEAARSLTSALLAEGIYTEPREQNPTNNPKHNKISLSVGSKR
jgi:rubrerythrin